MISFKIHDHGSQMGAQNCLNVQLHLPFSKITTIIPFPLLKLPIPAPPFLTLSWCSCFTLRWGSQSKDQKLPHYPISSTHSVCPPCCANNELSLSKANSFTCVPNLIPLIFQDTSFCILSLLCHPLFTFHELTSISIKTDTTIKRTNRQNLLGSLLSVFRISSFR